MNTQRNKIPKATQPVTAEHISLLAKRTDGKVMSMLLIVASMSVLDGAHRRAAVQALLQSYLKGE
jgi:hypothetical protein